MLRALFGLCATKVLAGLCARQILPKLQRRNAGELPEVFSMELTQKSTKTQGDGPEGGAQPKCPIGTLPQ